LGEIITVAVGEQFRPSAQAYAGETQHFSVILIPYGGDAPPAEDRQTALAYSYPPDAVGLPE
jgi:hypothetical protein